MLIDAVARAELDATWMRTARPQGAEGPAENLVSDVLAMPYFERPPPKSTGRELFGDRCATDLVRAGREAGLKSEDLLATATEITVRSIEDACRRFVIPVVTRLDELIVSGGGARNGFLLERLALVLAPAEVSTSDDHGLSSDAKKPWPLRYLPTGRSGAGRAVFRERRARTGPRCWARSACPVDTAGS